MGLDPGAPEPIADGHDLSAFASGEPALDDWLRRRARSNQASGASRTYVIALQHRVIGYFSLASGAITIAEAPSRARRNMPGPIPMAVLGRLAIDQEWQRRGLGRLLLRDAILRTSQAAAIIGVRGFFQPAYARRSAGGAAVAAGKHAALGHAAKRPIAS